MLVVDTEDRDWERAARVTADAIRTRSHDVVYQGVLIDPVGWRGVADFMERQADGSYEISDTKLARHPKPYFLLQLSFYSEQLGWVQGRLPERMHVVLGTNDRESFRVADFIAYYRRVRARFLGFVEHTPETYPIPVEHCQICAWKAVCEQRWIDDDHLSLVADMRRVFDANMSPEPRSVGGPYSLELSPSTRRTVRSRGSMSASRISSISGSEIRQRSGCPRTEEGGEDDCEAFPAATRSPPSRPASQWRWRTSSSTTLRAFE